MSFRATNPAGFPHLSPGLGGASEPQPSDVQRRGQIAPFLPRTCLSSRAAIAANFRSQSADKSFAPAGVGRYVSRLLLDHSFGLCGARRHAVFCFAFCAPWPRFLPRQVREPRQRAPGKLLSGPSQKADLRHLGAGPTRKLRST